ncbi:MAG: helix-turn-helix domain-containing protein [Anaerolineae bacterium]
MMAQDLWQLRRRKGMSVKQLAAKSGISVRDLTAYEDGKPVRTLDRHKLAKVLFVDASEIKVQSDPKPAKPKPKPKPAQAEKRPSPKPKPAKPAKKSTPPPARPGQIEHLLAVKADRRGISWMKRRWRPKLANW